MNKWRVIKGLDKVYPWDLIDPDGTPIAKFISYEEAELAAQAFNVFNKKGN